jgi:hypothetical protein
MTGLSRAGIARAVPAGSRRVASQREALRAGLACPDLAGVRADFREHLRDWWKIHVNHASWGGLGCPPRGITEPTRARVCQLAVMSVSTYKACRRWWEARGYIAIVRAGWTPDLAPGVLRTGEDRNIRQAYVLCTPRKTSRTGTPPCTSSAPARTRPLSQSRRDLDGFPAREEPPEGTGEPGKPGAPRSPVLRRGPLAALTGGWWAHITAPFAAWTAADLVWAVDHLPGGQQHRTSTASVRHPAGWLRWRLSHWLQADGTPLPSPSQQRAAAARRHRAYLAGRERDPVHRARRDQLRHAYGYDSAGPAGAHAVPPVRPEHRAVTSFAPDGRPEGAELARALLRVRDDRHRDAAIRTWQSHRPPGARSVTAERGHGFPAWNGSWTGQPAKPREMSNFGKPRGRIRAASSFGRPGQATCKRQASGSNPLTGSIHDSHDARPEG